MIDAEIAAWAERFWLLAGHREAFPRSLESSVAWALPLAIVKLPRLAITSINAYLAGQGLTLCLTTRERRLRACLVARAGEGIVFLDGADPDDERRFSLAHEVAHFLLDHLAPRQRAVEAFGPDIIDVLDGRRPPSPAERLHAVLREVALSSLTHLMDRNETGGVPSTATLDAEDRADQLALELLAPATAMVQSLQAEGLDWSALSAADALAAILVTEYGLPRWLAARYAQLQTTNHRPPPTFRNWLHGAP